MLLRSISNSSVLISLWGVPRDASHQCSKWNQPRWEWQKELHRKTTAIPSRGEIGLQLLYTGWKSSFQNKFALNWSSATAHVAKPNRASKRLKCPDSVRFYKEVAEKLSWLHELWSAVNVGRSCWYNHTVLEACSSHQKSRGESIPQPRPSSASFTSSAASLFQMDCSSQRTTQNTSHYRRHLPSHTLLYPHSHADGSITSQGLIIIIHAEPKTQLQELFWRCGFEATAFVSLFDTVVDNGQWKYPGEGIYTVIAFTGECTNAYFIFD